MEIAEAEPIATTVDRLLSVRDQSAADEIPTQSAVEAVLGGMERPKVRLSEALEIYFNEIAINEQMYKSPQQKASWRKIKALAVRYFTELLALRLQASDCEDKM